MAGAVAALDAVLASTAYRNCLTRWAWVLRTAHGLSTASPASLAGEVALRSSRAVSPHVEPVRDLRRRVLAPIPNFVCFAPLSDAIFGQRLPCKLSVRAVPSSQVNGEVRMAADF